MTFKGEKMKVSNCCGALPLRETYEDMGKCSKCKENAVFMAQEDFKEIK